MLLALVTACETSRTSRSSAAPHEPEGAPPAMPIPVIETHEVLPAPTPIVVDDEELGLVAEEEEDEVAADGAREIHPHGGMTDCLEMYSACEPDPDHGGAPRCTSAPMLLSCGQRGTIPGGDTLVCVCP